MELREQILKALCGDVALEEGIFNQDANKYYIIIDGKSQEYKNQRAWLKALEGAEDKEHSPKGAQDSIKQIINAGGEVELYILPLVNGKRPKATAKVDLISNKQDTKLIKKAAAAVNVDKYKFSAVYNPRTTTVDILMGNKTLVTLPNPLVAREAFRGVLEELNKLIVKYSPKDDSAPAEESTESAD